MGIDFSHTEAHWAYSGFMRFRNKLTESLGYTNSLKMMYEDNTYTKMKDEPIYPLINHSDCDGELSVIEMQQILPQLKNIIGHWLDDDYDKPLALQLIEGMEKAVTENVPLEFR